MIDVEVERIRRGQDEAKLLHRTPLWPKILTPRERVSRRVQEKHNRDLLLSKFRVLSTSAYFAFEPCFLPSRLSKPFIFEFDYSKATLTVREPNERCEREEKVSR